MTNRDNVLAARVLLSARRLARELGHTWIGTEHVLLGVLELDAVGARDALEQGGVTPGPIREELQRLAPSVDQPARADLPLARSLQDLLEGAVAKTSRRQLEDVRIEHLLLALLQRRAGLGYAILVKRDVDLDELERQLERLLDAPRSDDGASSE